MADIKFGTDGWRAKIADGFTFDNLRLVCRGTAVFFLKRDKKPVIAADYDNRYMSEHFARFVSDEFASYGIKVRLFDSAVPTPLVSLYINREELSGGVVITSSHNPWDYNGFKVKNKNGAGASTAETREIERLMGIKLKKTSRGAPVETVNYDTQYIRELKKYVDIKAIIESGIKITADAMYGPGGRFVEAALKGVKKLDVIHSKRDPLFGGITPEPIEKNLKGLSEAVVRNKSHIGIALDGDADRMALVDEHGRYITSHKALVMLLLLHVKYRKIKIKYMKTVAGTSLINKICSEEGVPLSVTPVGFKNIGEKMAVDKSVIGGEESGGMGAGYFLPERDGLITNLMILELLAKEKMKLGEYLSGLDRKYGPYIYGRVDLKFNEKNRVKIMESVKNAGEEGVFAGKKIAHIDTMDGIKFVLSDREWVLFRFSGTEPLLRIYSEAPSEAEVKRNLISGRSISAAKK